MQKHSKIKTGFSFFDQKWGGAYPGGNYFVFGSKKSGKTILALNIIENLVQANFSTLLLTSERKKSLEIQASSVYFDVEEAISGGTLKVSRIDNDFEDFENIKNLIRENNPSVLVIDELVDEKLKVLRENYLEFIEFLEESEITSFFLASVPSDDLTKNFVRKIAKNSTAIIQLQKNATKRNYSGSVTLKPNIGHFEGEFETTFKVEPIKGFITLADNESNIYNLLSGVNNNEMFTLPEKFEYSNIYNEDEFKFLLDSKIALINKSDEKINIISYEILDDYVAPIELCNTVKEKLTKGDKVCFTDKMLYILPVANEKLSAHELAIILDKEIQTKYNNIDEHVRKAVQLLKPNFKLV